MSTTAERYRDRARSAATLLATAAGALTAGLLFSSFRDDLSGAAQSAAYISWVFFIISSCLYLGASLYSRSTGTGSTDTFIKGVISRIRLLTTLGSFGGALAAGSLAAVLPLNLVFPIAEKRVVVELATDAPKITECAELSQSFQAGVTEKDLRGSSPLIPLRVSSADCNGLKPIGDKVVIYIDRTKALFAIEATKDDRNGG